jgi:DNA-binding GntR family transcriptional regulator
MNSQLQLWMPAVLSMFGALLVVVLTAWLNTRMLSAQIESLRAELRAEIGALRAETKQGFAELRLEFHQQITELSRRVERLEEVRGLVRP